MSNPETMPLVDLNQQRAEEFQALQTRMLNMEDALSRVIRHLGSSNLTEHLGDLWIPTDF